MGRALVDHADGANAGFLREDSILLVLLMCRDDDCSVAAGSEALFDPEDESMDRHIELRCINHPEMLVPVETYVEILETLRPDPRKLVVELIVGVPEGYECEGLGSGIPDCLDHPDMIEQIHPEWGYLLPSCVASAASGWPGRRFVQMAQHLGGNALVHTVCRDYYAPVLEALADVLHERVDGEEPEELLPMETDLADCRLVETLEDDSPCPEGLAELDVRGEDDTEHTQCVVPQVPVSGRGWTYDPGAPVGFRIRFSGGYEPMHGSTMRFLCCL